MSVDRYMPAHRFDPSAALLTGGIVAAVGAALLTIAPNVVRRFADPLIEILNIPVPPPLDPIVEPVPPEPAPRSPVSSKPVEQVDQPPVTVPLPDTSGWSVDPGLPLLPPGGSGGDGTAADPGSPPAPVIVDPAMDPRYANLFQPPYPPEETRAEREGIVVIRVLIGADGRVKQAERISAPSDAFWRATERQALGEWRFRPGTRDGVPEERWRTLRVRFELTE